MKKTELSALSDDPVGVAAYVAALTGELAQLARTSGLTTLAYLLEMARLEARNISTGPAEEAAKNGPSAPP